MRAKLDRWSHVFEGHPFAGLATCPLPRWPDLAADKGGEPFNRTFWSHTNRPVPPRFFDRYLDKGNLRSKTHDHIAIFLQLALGLSEVSCCAGPPIFPHR